MAIKEQVSPTIKNNGTAAEGLLLQVRELHTNADPRAKQARGAAQISDVSFQIEPHELVVLTGPGREVKSRLLRTLAGAEPKPGGEILINGVDLYSYHKVFPAYIGFVPAQPALHQALTVKEILRYEARLRLPGQLWREVGRQRIEGIIEALGLQQQAGQRFSTLTNYEKHLTSIAVELITQPGLLLLETPADSLEPAEEIQLSKLLKKIAQQGPTMIQSAVTARCAQIADKALVLAADGALAWFGPGDAALTYFQSFVPEGAGKTRPLTFDHVFELLAAPCPGGDDSWQKRFQANPAYETYVDDPLNDKYPDLLTQDRPLARFRGSAKEKTPPKKLRQASGISKYATLVNRALRVLGRERAGLWILLAPIAAALLDFLISSPTMFDQNQGDPVRVPVALGLVVFIEMLVAALIFHNEITKERRIYGRERRTLSLAVPYALSKVWIVFLAALYQGLVWGFIHFLASGMAGGVESLPWVWVTLALVALAGGIIGLIASNLARSPQVAILLVLALVVPQLMLSGSVLPIPRLDATSKALSAAAPTRYGFESLLSLSRYGYDISTDACWQAPEVMRNTFTEADLQNCNCFGPKIFEGSCNFPGIHNFFTVAIEQPQPDVPTPAVDLNTIPPQPTPRPGESIDSYAQAVSSYAQQFQQYQGQVNDYSQQLLQYAHNLSLWQEARSQVTGNTEGVIALAIEQYGQAFQVNLIRHWMNILFISLALVVILISLQLRKGYEI